MSPTPVTTNDPVGKESMLSPEQVIHVAEALTGEVAIRQDNATKLAASLKQVGTIQHIHSKNHNHLKNNHDL
jgi:hypothetical protein